MQFVYNNQYERPARVYFIDILYKGKRNECQSYNTHTILDYRRVNKDMDINLNVCLCLVVSEKPV